MTFAIVVGTALGAFPAVWMVYVLGRAAWLGAKEFAAWWRRRSQE
jgi:hypothetical protein